ncbi:MAG: DUF6056 family protein [Alphaproteobacteria bacterium]
MAKNKPILSYRSNGYWVMIPMGIYIAVVSYLTPLTRDMFEIIGDGKTLFAWQAAWNYYYGYYMNWGGRIAYLITGFLLNSFYRAPYQENFSQIIISTMNGMVFVLFLLALFLLAFARRPKFAHQPDQWRIWLLFFLMMTVLAKKGQTFFWIAGYCNYLWVLTLHAWFMVFYRLQWNDKTFLSFHDDRWKQALFFIFIFLYGIIAGMASEFGVLLSILLLLVGCGYQLFYKKISLPLWCYGGVAGIIIGYGLLMLSPGVSKRFHDEYFLSFRQTSFLEKLSNLPDIMVSFLEQTRFTPLLIWLAIYYWQKNLSSSGKNILHRFFSKITRHKNFGVVVVLTIGYFVFVAAQVFNPTLQGRNFFYPSVLFLLSTILVLNVIFFDNHHIFKRIYHYKKILFAMTSLAMVLYLGKILWYSYDFHLQFQARIATFAIAKASGAEEVFIKPYRLKNKFWGDVGMADYEIDLVSQYYGVKKIIRQ